jgi:hypothetical protein
MTWLINFILNHTGKRWFAEQDRIVQANLYYDRVIGQLPPREDS